jgi:DNA repair exonuclease SbcCD ATPase subunit
MQLDDVAAELLGKLKQLHAHVDTAHKALGEAQTRLDETKTRLDADSTALADELHGLEQRVGEEQSRLADEAREASEALDRLSDQVRSVAADAHQQIEQAKGEIDALEARVSSAESEVETLFGELRTVSDNAKSALHEAGGQVATAVSGAQAACAHAAQHIVGFRGALEARVHLLEQHVNTLTLPAIEAMVSAWSESLESIDDETLTRGAEMIDANLASVATEAAAKYREACGQVLDEVAALGERLNRAIDTMSAAIEKGAGDVASGGDAVLQDMRETGTSVEAVRAAFQEARQTLSQYSS